MPVRGGKKKKIGVSIDPKDGGVPGGCIGDATLVACGGATFGISLGENRILSREKVLGA